MITRIIGAIMMIGSLAFAWLYDTGRWSSFYAILQQGPNATLPTAQNSANSGLNINIPIGGSGGGTGGLPGIPTLGSSGYGVDNTGGDFGNYA